MDCPSAPEGYDIEKNKLFQDMNTYKSMLVLLRDGSHISLYCQGPPGVGKTQLPHVVLGSRLKDAKPNANNIVDVLQENRNAKRILLWDDTGFVWHSPVTLNLLNSAIDPGAGRRWIVDQKTKPHRRFAFDAKNLFLTNKDMLDTANLKGFSQTAQDIIPVINRFHLKCRMTFDSDDRFHYACWWGTDGGHMLRDLVEPKTGRHLTRTECNEVLAWFASNYPHLNDPSPRGLRIVGEHRLWAPTIWRSLCNDLLNPNTLKNSTIERQKQEPWIIPDSGKPKVRDEIKAKVIAQPVVKRKNKSPPSTIPEYTPKK